MMKNPFLDNKLLSLTKEAKNVFEEKYRIAEDQIANIPDSDPRKEKIRGLLKSVKNRNFDYKQLLAELQNVMKDAS